MISGSAGKMNDLAAMTQIQPYLHPGEKVLWTGRPGQGIRFRPSDWFVIPFGLAFGGFAVFWEASVIAQGQSFIAMLLGVPFVLFGLHLIAGRFFWDSLVRSQLIYATTNQRLITLRGKSLKSRTLRSLPQLNLQTGSDGEGTIEFGSDDSSSDVGSGTSFQFVRDAQDVYARILKAQAMV